MQAATLEHARLASAQRASWLCMLITILLLNVTAYGVVPLKSGECCQLQPQDGLKDEQHGEYE